MNPLGFQLIEKCAPWKESTVTYPLCFFAKPIPDALDQTKRYISFSSKSTVSSTVIRLLSTQVPRRGVV